MVIHWSVLSLIPPDYLRGYKQQVIEIIEYYLTADEIEVVNLNPVLFKAALGFYKTHQDKEWGIIDCLSFIVTKEASIDEVLTFDKHCTQAGF